MSRTRTRPTREETRHRLLEAAAAVFADEGVGGASVERIAEAAGFTRGAFYSNFESKEELALAMLDAHLEVGETHNRALAERHGDPADLVEALRHDTGRDDPLHRDPMLQIELLLFVARNEALRPRLGEQLRRMRRIVGDMATHALGDRVAALDIDAARLGMLLVALEDGLRLHRLVDPRSTPEDAFVDALDLLQRLAR